MILTMGWGDWRTHGIFLYPMRKPHRQQRLRTLEEWWINRWNGKERVWWQRLEVSYFWTSVCVRGSSFLLDLGPKEESGEDMGLGSVQPTSLFLPLHPSPSRCLSPPSCYLCFHYSLSSSLLSLLFVFLCFYPVPHPSLSFCLISSIAHLPITSSVA